MNETKLRFGFECKKHEGNFWGLGMNLAHMYTETYLTILLFKHVITIGKFWH